MNWMNKKGMLASLIGGFVAIFIGISLTGTIAAQVNAAMDCNLTIDSLTDNLTLGETGSFGGGGAAHFGGYDGKVVHNDFSHAIAQASLIKANETSPAMNPDCKPLTGSARTLMQIVPLLFALSVMGVGLATAFSGLRSGGLV